MDTKKPEETSLKPPAGPQVILTDNRNDGNLLVSFSESEMEVKADFIPPRDDGKPLTRDFVAEILDKLNIVYGIRWDAIQESIMDCNLSRRRIKNVVIALGDSPSAEVSEYFEKNPHLGQGERPAENKARIDHRNYSPFIIVKKDQTLAKLRSRKTGKEGKNVYGASLPFAYTRPEGVSGGENTRVKGNFIIANINGQLVESGKVLSVQESLVIKGAVGYGTGNIIFPGDVLIEGPVSDGFKIYSGGSVTIKQTFDVTDVNTKGDLSVAGGIIGKGPALVKVGGAIKTKFIENCRVAARKAIAVDAEIINSNVFTLENVDMGDKGLILGGDIYAVHGIKAGGLGKKTGKATRIHCGIDFTVQQQKERSNNELRLLAAKLVKLREFLVDPETGNEKRAKVEELIHRLEADQQAASVRVSDLMGRINVDENAAVEITGDIVPGTLIEICQIALFVSEPLHKVRIKLDKASGKLLSEPL
ncbi:MAG: FapA family protein [Treponema sp.]|nr:FapA family protein [Treponema sp.]